MAVLTWAGLRGGVSIALALTLPASEYRGRLLIVCYTVVVFSMLLQGVDHARGDPPAVRTTERAHLTQGLRPPPCRRIPGSQEFPLVSAA
jgi:hypothetical protein